MELVGGGVKGVLLLLEIEPLDPFSPSLPSTTTALTPHPSSGGPAARQAGCHGCGRGQVGTHSVKIYCTLQKNKAGRG